MKDLFAELQKITDLDRLTVFRSKRDGDTAWQVSIKRVGALGYSCYTHADLDAALRFAIKSQQPRRPARPEEFDDVL